jgi:hypothetical protein
VQHWGGHDVVDMQGVIVSRVLVRVHVRRGHRRRRERRLLRG